MAKLTGAASRLLSFCTDSFLEMNESDRQIALFYELHDGLPQQGPGSEASTLRALSLVPALPAAPVIVDFGCGPGPATLVLAQATDGRITAIDNYQPFLDALDQAAAARDLSQRIITLNADMAAAPIAPASVDLIWAEGAIYQIGFEEGLRRWWSFLRPDGAVAVTEATWLDADPPEPIRLFWQREYPAMTDIAGNVEKICTAGYTPIDHFVLPASDWENYYAPLEQRIQAFARQYPNDPDARAVIESGQAEIDLWRQYGDSYGYVFYIAQVSA